MKPAQQAREALAGKEPLVKDSIFLSIGVSLLDLAAYGKIGHGLQQGRIYRFCGRSSSGKTFCCRTILAEAANNPAFNEFELIYDDVERGALMDTEKFFGKKLVERLSPPGRGKGGIEIYSRTTLDFYQRVGKRLEAGKKFIWVLDSLDCLAPDAETKMGDGKAKIHSQELRKLIDPLAETGSILILTSQAKVDMLSMFGGETTAGGRSPEFYSTLDVWLRKIKPIKVKYKEKPYTIGHWIQARIQKNRLSGRDRVVYFPFYPDYGIDDIGANIEFMVKSGFWKRTKGIIQADALDMTGTTKQIIKAVEESGLHAKLQATVSIAWKHLEKAISVQRRPRYQ